MRLRAPDLLSIGRPRAALIIPKLLLLAGRRALHSKLDNPQSSGANCADRSTREAQIAEGNLARQFCLQG